MKNPFKKKPKFPKAPVPRAREEIITQYQDLRARAGELQYNIVVRQEDLKRLNQSLMELNYEMAARENLDKEVAADLAKTEPKEKVNEA